VSEPPISARFAHVNLIADDWRALARFYADLFGCQYVPPERDYAGPDLARGTGVAGAALRGAHLRLPGYGADGPTLEIFQYARSEAGSPPAANRRGYGHICFAVSDVEQARRRVLAAGGGTVGDIVTLQTSDSGRLTWCYVTDPEGNIIELQAVTA
jgi:catechol 2,3-dioxygenase-like lactoylglutathione lyase family enzyme